MLFLLKPLIAAMVFILRLRWRRRPTKPTGHVDGVPYFRIQRWSEDRNPYLLLVGIPFDSAVFFRLSAERAVDRFFKKVGLAKEIQTGDADFDAKVYIACDHPAFADVARSTPELRKHATGLLAAGFRYIYTDGKFLWADSRSLKIETEEHRRSLVALKNASARFEANSASRQRDPFLERARVLDAFIWSVATFGALSGLELLLVAADYHLNPHSVVVPGVFTDVILLALLFWLVTTVLRGSSRGHRLLVESAVVLLATLPFAGIQLVSDVNRGLDRSTPIVQSVGVAVLSRKHRGYSTYYLRFGENLGPASVPLPEEMQIGIQFYEQVKNRSQIDVVVGGGLLGYPWYREIRVRR